MPALTSSPSTASDAAHCARIVKHHARTFALASRFLPAPKQRAAYALYAFCRVADDMVDLAVERHETGTQKKLAEYDRTLLRTYNVPLDVLRELVAGVARDLAPVRYPTWGELARYCEGVASTVGEMCTHVFGVVGGTEVRERALRYARILGVAMQLTNILRDVGEDAGRGRCYLPDDDLALFGLTPADILGGRLTAEDERWRPFMAFEVGRARALYEMARPGIALLAPDSQRCATACAVGYAGILGAIEGIGYDTLQVRARMSTPQRVRLFWNVWRSAPVVADVVALGEGPSIRFELGEPAGPFERVKLA
ncbi:MAG: phytoene/squalene synthase family protein [Gemmatimonadetes bacterium]|nr:phytoene/squalene synthase family protein [Gemmatimonadota bacterium]